ncbi:MAG: DUF4422 domain-containing protein [Clostridia bacterium]|nr:DUF4422 domain-containing protein [Clostridia bacterium]
MIKILIVHHKPTQLLKNDVFTPIRVGAALSTETNDFDDNVLSDADGENISAKNPTYNELTAIYWAYKNYEKLGDPDYLGLMHYRRFFIFEPRKYAYYEQKNFDNIENAIKANNLTEDLLDACDFVAPMPNPRKSVYQSYSASHHKEDIDLALEIISNKHPGFYDTAKEYVSSQADFFYNMFILKKSDFFDYCNFLFSVMEEYEQKTTHKSERFFISEILTGIFFAHLINNGKKPLLLPVLYIGKKPSFKQSVAECKRNFKENTSGFLFKIKPLIVFFTPNFILLKRKRKTAKIKNKNASV